MLIGFSMPLASGFSIDSPKEQFSNGIDPHDVKCKETFELVFKPLIFLQHVLKQLAFKN
jgi:hypothetical protein